MAGALVDAVRATLRTRTEPLEGRALVNPGAGHDERVLGQVEVVGGVGDGAVEHLADRLAGCLGGEAQHSLSLRGRQATDEVHHTAGLPGRDADEPRLGPGFHDCSSHLFAALSLGGCGGLP